MRAIDVYRVDVYRGDARAGSLSRTDAGAEFEYDPAFVARHAEDPLAGVAFTMPPRSAPYVCAGTNLHPFFAGLLPEGLRMRALVSAVKTSPADLFSLLVAVGTDTVGDVAVAPPGARPEEKSPILPRGDLGEVRFRELLARSLAFDGSGDYGAVAGVQPKVSVAMISVPVRSSPYAGHCLLKLSPAEFPRLVENEAFFMRVAADAGLKVARTELVHDAAGEAALLVERFDRVRNQDGSIERLHQEDACQLLDRYPADKYRLSLQEVADALDVCSAPVVARLELLRLQAFSYLIAGGDLQAKNVSVQTVGARVVPTPAYDIVSTLPYGDQRLALPMEGRDDRLERAHFTAFGERVGVRAAATVRMLDRITERVAPWVARLEEIGLPRRPTEHLRRTMLDRLERLGSRT